MTIKDDSNPQLAMANIAAAGGTVPGMASAAAGMMKNNLALNVIYKNLFKEI